MATKIFLPRLGESITEAVIGKWLKQPGDSVMRGEVIAELETAKAMMELESPAKGTLLAVFPKPGDTIHMEELLAVVGTPGEEWESPDKLQSVESEPKPIVQEQSKEGHLRILQENVSRLMISPNAKRKAKELGVSQEQIDQITKEGRITAQDIESLVLGAEVPDPEFIPFVRIPLNQTQIITARRMLLSMQIIPQFSVSIDINAEGLINFINSAIATGKPKLTITAILIWKVAEALLKHPQLNSRFDKDSVLQFQEINVAVAVAAKDGLIVPVIHQTDKLLVDEIAVKLEEVSLRAKNKRLELRDTQKGTFTISNLGMKGISNFIPLVDPDQTAILGVGALQDSIFLDENSNIHSKKIFTLTLSADHRVVGGAEVADFLATIKQLIEKL